jgi:hypothetical protein
VAQLDFLTVTIGAVDFLATYPTPGRLDLAFNSDQEPAIVGDFCIQYFHVGYVQGYL